MAKGNPIGVRFDEDMLVVLRKDHGIDSPQKALNFLYNYWRMTKHKVDPMAGVMRDKEPEKPDPNDAEILKQIESVEAETEPSHLKTPLGRASWNNDKIKRIWALKAKLKKKE